MAWRFQQDQDERLHHAVNGTWTADWLNRVFWEMAEDDGGGL